MGKPPDYSKTKLKNKLINLITADSDGNNLLMYIPLMKAVKILLQICSTLLIYVPSETTSSIQTMYMVSIKLFTSYL